jgi:hypothetical protein
LDVLLNLLACDAGLEKELGELKDAAQCVTDLYVPQEEGAEPKPLIDQLDEAEGRIKGLRLDSANLAVAAMLSTVKYHDPSFDLQKVSEDVDLSCLIRREDVVVAVGRSSRSLTSTLTEVVLKGAFRRGLGRWSCK